MSITTTSVLPPPVQQWFDKVLLSRPMPKLIHKKFALAKQLPANSGKTVRYRRYTNLATATVPLGTSGLNPPPQTLSAVDIDATIDWYGTYVLINEQVTLTNEDPVLNQTASLLSQSMKETDDELTRNMLAATASQVNCVMGANGDNPTELNRADIDAVIQALISNNANMISDNIEGSLKFGTAPIREAFFALMDSALIDDLEAVTGFISQAQYPAAQNILSAEWGSVGNARFLYTSIGSEHANASALGATVYDNFFVGQEAYACVDLEGAAAEFIYKPKGWGNDYLNLNQSAGWKMAQVPRILNDAWLINLRATHS